MFSKRVESSFVYNAESAWILSLNLSNSRQKGDIKDTREHSGVFSSDFSDAFDISYLEIEKNDGTKLSFRREIKKAKEFWDLYFT